MIGAVPAGTATAELVDLHALGDAVDDGFRYTETVALEPCRSQALRSLGVHSELVVPVAPDGVLLAVLTADWATSADQCWDDALGTYVQAFGQVLTAMVQRSRSEAVVHHRALHDPLTGLANRSLLTADVRDGLSRLTNRDRGGLALLYLAEDVANRIRAAVVNRAPTGLTDPLDISIGIAWTDQPCEAEDLFREADRQMYLVKRTRYRREESATCRPGRQA